MLANVTTDNSHRAPLVDVFRLQIQYWSRAADRQAARIL